MPFEPFGYSFELKSPSPPPDVKAAIRSRLKGWFDPKNGARGWIVGSFICLWFSAFDQHGPMLFGRISRVDLGTRISGRAGSDLNGLLCYSLLLLCIVPILYQPVSAGDYTANELGIIVGLVLLSSLIFWLSHKDRREAEPLVRFLRDAVTISGRSLRAKAATKRFSDRFTLNLGGEPLEGPVTQEKIHDALLAVGAENFVILESGPETYIQTASADGGYILEKRDGNNQMHFQALRKGAVPIDQSGSNTAFTFPEVREAFIAYATSAPIPLFMTWERLPLAD
ncbi:MAG: hypothetical protein K2W86_01455 [Sphingomonas sp.]|nr:hypothetical protein [Sphingomonas sp.]